MKIRSFNKTTIALSAFLVCHFVATGQVKIKVGDSLVPDIPNPSPDYFCTWQTQQYYSNAGGSELQRANINEANLFGNGLNQGWINFYPNAKRDLIFVMDDSWDVPLIVTGEKGSLILNNEKFTGFAKPGTSNQDAIKNLNLATKTKGWKAIGGWVCAEESPMFLNGRTPQEYWIERAKWANYSGFAYWKVDWGKKIYDYDFRKMLTDIAHQYAPNLNVENVQVNSVIPVSDIFRTYDVPAIMSISMTMKKLKYTLDKFTAQEGYKGLINCEDEVYIAAALGCTMGVLRQPMAGNLPNGKPDVSWPAFHRNIKTKIDEVTRAVRWHRIAPAFGVNEKETEIDSVSLTDFWVLKNKAFEIEPWWFEPWTGLHVYGDSIIEPGPARISRRMQLPQVIADENGDVPFIVASKNPNGAVTVATLGRTVNRRYWTPACDVSISTGKARTFGIFGYYKNLTIKTSLNLDTVIIRAQDLAGNKVLNITSMVKIEGCDLIIPGDVITIVGTGEQAIGDTSDPGLVLVISTISN